MVRSGIGKGQCWLTLSSLDSDSPANPSFVHSSAASCFKRHKHSAASSGTQAGARCCAGYDAGARRLNCHRHRLLVWPVLWLHGREEQDLHFAESTTRIRVGASHRLALENLCSSRSSRIVGCHHEMLFVLIKIGRRHASICAAAVQGGRRGARRTFLPSGLLQNPPRTHSPHLLDVGSVGEQHGEAVDAHAPAAGGGQPILQRRAKVLVYQLRLVVARLLVLCNTSSDSGQI